MLMEREIDLSTPSLPALSYLLRHRELWPQGFRWEFRHYDTCAIGLTCAQWFDDFVNPMYHAINFCADNCSTASAYGNIFGGGISRLGPDGDEIIKTFYGISCDDIMPEHVADKIDEYLAQQQPKIQFTQ